MVFGIASALIFFCGYALIADCGFAIASPREPRWSSGTRSDRLAPPAVPAVPRHPPWHLNPGGVRAGRTPVARRPPPRPPAARSGPRGAARHGRRIGGTALARRPAPASAGDAQHLEASPRHLEAGGSGRIQVAAGSARTRRGSVGAAGGHRRHRLCGAAAPVRWRQPGFRAGSAAVIPFWQRRSLAAATPGRPGACPRPGSEALATGQWFGHRGGGPRRGGAVAGSPWRRPAGCSLDLAPLQRPRRVLGCLGPCPRRSPLPPALAVAGGAGVDRGRSALQPLPAAGALRRQPGAAGGPPAGRPALAGAGAQPRLAPAP